MTALRTIDDVTCLACGCLCDDIQLRFEGDQFTSAEHACEHGAKWFRHHAEQSPPADALINRQSALFQMAVDRAADLLAAARYPLVFGLGYLQVEAQREAIALAELLGAIVDGAPADPTSAFFPGIGESSCTWGEVRDRADLIVYWGWDLNKGHWRHAERILDPATYRPNTRVLLFDDELEMNTLWTLRGLIRGKPVNAAPEIRELAATLAAAQYGVIIHDGNASAGLKGLVIDLNRTRRFRLIDLGRGFNDAGQTQVLTWQTGHPKAVGLHRGYPIHFGSEFSAESVLRRGESDAAFIVGDAESRLPAAAREYLSRIPRVSLSLGASEYSELSQVTLFASVPGIHAAGTVFRSDSISLPLRPAFSTSFPDPVSVLKSLTDAVRSRRSN